jgi:large subunit ribosomal protein L2
MALKTYRPVTPSMRQLVLVDRSELWRGKPVKALTEGLSKSGGRNNLGRITTWHRGGGHKRRHWGGRAPRVRSQPLGVHRAGQV